MRLPSKRAERSAITSSHQRDRLGLKKTPLAMSGLRGLGGNVRYARCQWIEGEPGANDDCKCGNPVERNRPYCTAHWAMAWRPREA